MNFLTEKDIARFWSKVDRRGADECWPWNAKAKLWSGYGVLKHKSGKNVVASRISCWLAHGDPPHEKAHSLHSCDNPPCCNPAHLRWGDQADNVRDAINRGRHKKPPRSRKGRDNPLKGEKGSNCKTTEPQVRRIWEMHLAGATQTEIAAETGAGRYAVNEITRGRSWRHLPEAPSVEALKSGGVRRGYNQFTASLIKDA